MSEPSQDPFRLRGGYREPDAPDPEARPLGAADVEWVPPRKEPKAEAAIAQSHLIAAGAESSGSRRYAWLYLAVPVIAAIATRRGRADGTVGIVMIFVSILGVALFVRHVWKSQSDGL